MNTSNTEIELNNNMICVIENKLVTLKEQKLTALGIEEKVRHLKYSGQRREIDPAVENAKLPSMVRSFYELVVRDDSLPDEKQFVEAYLNRYFEKIGRTTYRLKKAYREENSPFVFKKDGLEGRILRAYPSLIRDLHFFLLCKESGLFEKVIYSTYADIYEGIDLKLKKDGQVYIVSLFVNTNRSKQFKKRKYKRHDYSNVVEICVMLDLDTAKKVGDFILYDERHINYLLDMMNTYKDLKTGSLMVR